MSEVWKSYIYSSQMRLLGETPHLYIIIFICVKYELKCSADGFKPKLFLHPGDQDHLHCSMWSGTEYLFIERKQFINFTLPNDFLTISFASIFRMRWKTKIQFDSFLLQTKS